MYVSKLLHRLIIPVIHIYFWFLSISALLFRGTFRSHPVILDLTFLPVFASYILRSCYWVCEYTSRIIFLVKWNFHHHVDSPSLNYLILTWLRRVNVVMFLPRWTDSFSCRKYCQDLHQSASPGGVCRKSPYPRLHPLSGAVYVAWVVRTGS